MTKIWLVYPHDIVGELIDTFQGFGEDPAHAAIILTDNLGKQWVYEAVRGGFRKTEMSVYNHKRVVEYSVNIPDLPSATAKAEELLGNNYGYLSCVEGVVFDALGLSLSRNGESATNCSESVTIIVRSGGYNVCPGIPASCITPEGLQEYFDGQGIVGELRVSA